MGDTFTVQLSSSLVNSLVNASEKSKKKTKKTKSKTPREPPQTKDDSGTHQGAANSGWPLVPLQPPLFMPATPPPPPAIAELEAIRTVLQESEKVVERLQKQEENMVQEVTQRAKDLRDKEFKIPYQKPLPCLAEKDACLSCYKEHAKDPLKCANAVKFFADCARRVRQEVHSANK